ncbi:MULTISPECIES: hypothetical protein [Methanobacterium]|uniref:Uncharacterized protein n=1 Tax=Methanobacterium veterum TaxID=408577 RepID=A0A9E4ZV77_9EURY|nr:MULTISPECIES: hypothetical protein [Methanobacterium]MCZ3365641.1 hypothetical protein [Methanobacterium veterum]MCZ3371105.1 hypothetical protein [Methanobacterium veterum]
MKSKISNAQKPSVFASYDFAGRQHEVFGHVKNNFFTAANPSKFFEF